MRSMCFCCCKFNVVRRKAQDELFGDNGAEGGEQGQDEMGDIGASAREIQLVDVKARNSVRNGTL